MNTSGSLVHGVSIYAMGCSLVMIFLSQLPAFGTQFLAIDEETIALERLLHQYPHASSLVTHIHIHMSH